MKLVGYIRVSTQDQADNTSLADQRKKIESYCVAMGHELIEVFEEVGSGKNTTDRPLFAQALEAVRYLSCSNPNYTSLWPVFVISY
jgi:site-specific DNA recombinase